MEFQYSEIKRLERESQKLEDEHAEIESTTARWRRERELAEWIEGEIDEEEKSIRSTKQGMEQTEMEIKQFKNKHT